jgi:LemA protein
MQVLAILIIILIAVAFYVASVFNALNRLKTQITASIQEIGNQLKRQANLIPNLESAVKGYMGQEKSIFKMLTDARKSVTQADKSGKMEDIDQAVDQIQSLVPQLRVVLESNPDIKSDQTVVKFMNELTDTADKLTYARRSLIDLAQSYNQRLVVFPSNLVAKMFGFEPEKGLATATTGEHVTVSDEDMKMPKVDLS